MQPHGGNEWSREISAHLPVDTNDLTGFGSANECLESCFCQLTCPADIFTVAGDEGRLTKSMNPFGEIMEVLTVSVPLLLLVDGFLGTTLPTRLTNPKAAQRRVVATFFVIESTDPAFANVVTAITSELSMDLIDQPYCAVPILLVACALA